MIDEKIVLASSITLLFREHQLEDQGSDSVDLVREALSYIDIKDQHLGVNVEKQILQAMKDMALEMCDTIDPQYDLTVLLQRVKLITQHDPALYTAVEDGVRRTMEQPAILNAVLNLRAYLNKYIRTEKAGKLLAAASYNFRYNRQEIGDLSAFLQKHVTECESLQVTGDVRDPAVMNEIMLHNVDEVTENLERAKEAITGSRVYRTGWVAMNNMLQGGFRPSNIATVNALPHNYKTGCTLSMYRHITTYNVPYYLNLKNKKPLALRISFEDNLEDNLQFLYQEIKFTETRAPVDIKGVSSKDMADYIREVMQRSGFEVKMVRVDPTRWSYRQLVDYVLKVESQGYKVEILMIDYLGMLPTTGCNTSGPMGTDMRDLFRRVRNFCTARDICCITPHQLSTDAQALERQGTVPTHLFVKELDGKGYTAGSKQLGQELDLEIYIHKVKHNGKWYLSFQRGKHRIPTIVDDEDKYFLLPFPHKMPIPADIDDETPSHFHKLPSAARSEDSAGLF